MTRYYLILSIFVCLLFTNTVNAVSMRNGQVNYKKQLRYLHGKPAIVNIVIVDTKQTKIEIKPSFGQYFLNKLCKVKDIVSKEQALIGINGSYFKPDNGSPIGLSIINSAVVTGPLYKRVAFGVSGENTFSMEKVDIKGQVNIGNDIAVGLFNINQPVLSKNKYSIFTHQWGNKTPHTKKTYIHIAVVNNKIAYIKQSNIKIPKDGYVLVGPRKYLSNKLKIGDRVDYISYLTPDNWNNVRFAIAGGPYLVKNGRKFIDKQNFPKKFLWTKSPRTAVGYTKSGLLILITVDGKNNNRSFGATISELSQLMKENGAYNAMNLDGGTSTQMVINGKLVSSPLVKGGSKVTNALVVKVPCS